jgi:hypothetical protein
VGLSGCVKRLLGSNLFLPHGRVTALLGEKIIVGAPFDNRSGMKHNDLISMRNGGQTVSANGVSVDYSSEYQEGRA